MSPCGYKFSYRIFNKLMKKKEHYFSEKKFFRQKYIFQEKVSLAACYEPHLVYAQLGQEWHPS